MRISLDERSSLRPIALDDAEPIFRIVSKERPRLERWLPWVELAQAASDTRTFIEGALTRASEGSGVTSVIECDDAIAGVIGLDSIDALNRSAEVGYWICERAEGRGIVTRAVAAIVDHAFGSLALHRIVLRAAVDNARSRAVAERLGFTQEGIQRAAERHGEGYRDLAAYSLLAGEQRRP